jgi:hypothetical protein
LSGLLSAFWESLSVSQPLSPDQELASPAPSYFFQLQSAHKVTTILSAVALLIFFPSSKAMLRLSALSAG